VRQGYRDMRNNLPLARAFGRHLAALRPESPGPRETDARVGAGSTDMGDVSHAVPAMHPWIAICDEGYATCHQHAFAKCAAGERGLDAMLAAAKAMARAGAEFLTSPSLRDSVREAFERRDD